MPNAPENLHLKQRNHGFSNNKNLIPFRADKETSQQTIGEFIPIKDAKSNTAEIKFLGYKNMKKSLITILIFTTSIFISCDTKGEPIEHGKVCDVINDGKVVETSGYLDDKGGIFCSNIGGGRMECGLTLKNDLKDKKEFTAYIALDSGANSMDKLESGYKREDIRIRDNNDKQIDLFKKTKVTGTISVGESLTSNDGKVCFVKVTKIEQ